jgi:hypothetical protein
LKQEETRLNQAPAKQESRELKTGNPLVVALQSPKIITATAEDISQALRYVMVKVGLRATNFPNALEKEILLKHIQENYGGHTVAEIRLAFEMAIAGKLEVDANCYENFSCLYFSNVMNAYRKWAKEEYKESVREEGREKEVDRVTIDLEYAFYKQKLINKLPVRV